MHVLQGMCFSMDFVKIKVSVTGCILLPVKYENRALKQMYNINQGTVEKGFLHKLQVHLSLSLSGQKGQN